MLCVSVGFSRTLWFQSSMISLDRSRLKTEQVTGVKVMNSGLQRYATKSRSQNSTSDRQRPPVTGHTAARISDRQSACFRRSRRGDIFTVNDVYCGPIKSLICHSTKSLFVLLLWRRWAVRLRVSIIKPSHRVTCRIKKKDLCFSFPKTSN